MRPGRELLERPRRYFSYVLLLVLPIVLVVAIIRVMGRADGAMQDPVEPLWLSREEVAQLPASGPAWTLLKVAADTDLRVARIADQDSEHDTNTLAAALVYTRTHDDAYRAKVAGAIEAAIGTQKGGRVLALARNLPAYPIAADLIDLAAYDPALDTRFRTWLRDVRDVELKGRSLISTHERRPNNWGTFAGAARVAASAYLGDTADVAEAAKVFKGWLGDRASYAGFEYQERDCQANESSPVGINPQGATKVIDGRRRNVDRVLPEEQRRQGDEGRGPGKYASWPPAKENYAWEALQGAMVTAELLRRQGYPDAWDWEDQAILRATRWLYEQADNPAEGDDIWLVWLLNHGYGSDFPANAALKAGKNMGWTEWTHARPTPEGG